MAERPVDDIIAALDEQTVVVAGTDAAALIVPSLAGSLRSVLEQRVLLAGRIEELLAAHPLSWVLTSMPGIGVRTAARILIDVGDATAFPTAGHLASYAGLAPVTKSSGSSIAANTQPGAVTLDAAERASVLRVLTSPAYRDLAIPQV